MKKQLLFWFGLGLLLRLIIIPITLHPDIRGYNLAALWITQGEVFTFYDHLSLLNPQHPLVVLYHPDLLIYPPLAYLYPAFFMVFTSLFIPAQTFSILMSDMGQVIGRSDLTLLLYLLKLPYLVPDLLIAWLIGYFFKQPKDQLFARIAWLFNPVVIYATYMISQFDVLLALAVLGSVLLAKRGHFFWAAVALGLGAAVKQFPIFLLPILALYAPLSIPKRLQVFATGVGTYLLILLPFLPSAGFRNYALMASQTDKLFFSKIPLSGAEALPLFLVGFILLLWFCWYHAQRLQLWQWYLLAFMIFYSFIHFHPQWFTWGTPLLVIFLVTNMQKHRLPLAGLLLSYLGMVLLFEPSLNIGIFQPLYGAWTDQVSLMPYFTKFMPEVTLRSMMAGIFSATAGFIGWLLIRMRTETADK